MKKIKQHNLAIYQTKSGAIEVEKDAKHNTIWATQADIVRLYEKDQSVIS